MGLKFNPMMGRRHLRHLSVFGLMVGTSGPTASPNSSNRGFNPPPASHPPPPPAPLPSHTPTPYNAASVILQWLWKKLLKIQQCKLPSRTSYKMLAIRLFQLHSIAIWRG